MKIRYGFVSNSSASSFIVKIREKDIFDDMEFVYVTDEEINALKDFGFNYVKTHNPTDLYYREHEKRIWSKKPTNYLAMCVSCNQDEIGEFLIKNNIPFEASVQYAEENWVYNHITRTLTIGDNPGMSIGLKHKNFRYSNKDCYRDITQEDYLKENEDRHIARENYLKENED